VGGEKSERDLVAYRDDNTRTFQSGAKSL
jgi:hypothetical protein